MKREALVDGMVTREALMISWETRPSVHDLGSAVFSLSIRSCRKAAMAVISPEGTDDLGIGNG